MRNIVSQLWWTAWALASPQKTLRATLEIPDLAHLDVPSGTRLVVLDKDNCFARPHELTVWPLFADKMAEFRAAKDYEVVILSNTAGDAEGDPQGRLARALETSTGLPVLRHALKKPMCHTEIRTGRWASLKPSEVLIVGDRLATDVLMANVMGAQSVWIRPGAHPGWLNWVEMRLSRFLK